MAEVSAAPPAPADESVVEAGGSYEVIRARLLQAGRDLRARVDTLNQQRSELFGSRGITNLGSKRIRTENNCVPRDIVEVSGHLLFGFNVYIGLKAETSIGDVFNLYEIKDSTDATDLGAVSLDAPVAAFLGGETFRRDFAELYRFYKETRLVQLVRNESRFLAVFQIGAAYSDKRVFHWRVDPDGTPTYVDARGEREHQRPRQHDFEWVPCTREDQVAGRHPHYSVLDEVFVETVGGDLTVKIENNTEDGLGIYREPVEVANQTLDDAQIEYAKLGTLILLRVLPYNESEWRHLVYSTRTQQVVRIDQIAQACVPLPEDHGILFPGGYFLQDGQHKVFDGDFADFAFERRIRAPNGEDVLYVFHRPTDGGYRLLAYNLVKKEMHLPLACHGYSLFEDGRLVVFRATSDEPTRVHTLQVWGTPFLSAERAAALPPVPGLLGKIGNAELVRGCSDAYTVARQIIETQPNRRIYEDLVSAVARMRDHYYWLDAPEVGAWGEVLATIASTAELIIDEFDKVTELRARAQQLLDEAIGSHEQCVRNTRPEIWTSVEQYLEAMTDLRQASGHWVTLRDVRYIDVPRIEALERQTNELFNRVSKEAVRFLLKDAALAPLDQQITELLAAIEQADKTPALRALDEKLARTANGLTLLSEVVAGLAVDDPTQRTTILERISGVFAKMNRVRATLENRKQQLGSAEAAAEFGAQITLLSQSVAHALAQADTPERCDEQQGRLLVQLEELEGRFAEFDEFVTELVEKRTEIYDVLSERKQQLLDARQRSAARIAEAAQRIIANVGRRAREFGTADEIATYFASDPMLLRLRDLQERLTALGDATRADEIEAQVKTAQQEARRLLRDRLELSGGDENVIVLGAHRFSVNTQPLELTILPGESGMRFVLTGTDYSETVIDDDFAKARPYWNQHLVSENEAVYRGEYLATDILGMAERSEGGLSLRELAERRLRTGGLLDTVREVAMSRHDEGYERGIHDADASLVLEALLHLRESAGLLRFPAVDRSLACLFWARMATSAKRSSWHLRAQSLGRLAQSHGSEQVLAGLRVELAEALSAARDSFGATFAAAEPSRAAHYLTRELAKQEARFVVTPEASAARDALLMGEHAAPVDAASATLEDDLNRLGDDLAAQLDLALAWTSALAERRGYDVAAGIEAAVLMLTNTELPRHVSAGLQCAEVEGLLGQHPRIKDQKLSVRLDEVIPRVDQFQRVTVPGYRAYRAARQQLIAAQRRTLRLDEFRPRVLSSFVRNQLINEVYLPLFGANLAKQLGAAGSGKRTDLMGLLLLISPPGYGKTTLMEYLASKLGLVFLKVNGPAVGHAVTSLDPAEAPNATARQEVEKINLGFEMGSNVMLYLDDIQHTNPELLQKFISLCDAQRRVEGVWRNQSRTYDLRGKRFCIVMAGNPYTESGGRFQVPDMLANRADTYNLGDILTGKEDVFAQSYLENAVTSNPTLSPLAVREQRDLYAFISRARGNDVDGSVFSHDYSAVEAGEIVSVLRHLFLVQRVLLLVNEAYIASASMDDRYRTEPSFKLQGSYRNMNKLAEKIAPAMTPEEVELLVDDHYVAEAQTLTTGAEHNLLKLAELRGRMTDAQRRRWAEIKETFAREKLVGGGDQDPVTRVTGQLSLLENRLVAIASAIGAAAEQSRDGQTGAVLGDYLERLGETIDRVTERKIQIQVQNEAPPGVDDLLRQQTYVMEHTLVPFVKVATQRLDDSEVLRQQLDEFLLKLAHIDATIRERFGTSR